MRCVLWMASHRRMPRNSHSFNRQMRYGRSGQLEAHPIGCCRYTNLRFHVSITAAWNREPYHSAWTTRVEYLVQRKLRNPSDRCPNQFLTINCVYLLYSRDIKNGDKCPYADFHSGPLCRFTLRTWGVTHALQAEIEDRWFWLRSCHSNRYHCVVHFEFWQPDCRMASPVFPSFIRKNGSFATFWYVGDVEQSRNRRDTQHPKHGQNTGATFGKRKSTIKDLLFRH